MTAQCSAMSEYTVATLKHTAATESSLFPKIFSHNKTDRQFHICLELAINTGISSRSEYRHLLESFRRGVAEGVLKC